MAASTRKPKKLKILQHPAYGWTRPARDANYYRACHSIATIRGIETLAVSVRKRHGRKVEEIVGEKHSLCVTTNLGIYCARLVWFRVCPRPRFEHGCSSEAVIPMKIEISRTPDETNLVGVGVVDCEAEKVIYETGWADTAMETLECFYDHLQEAICDAYEEDWKKIPDKMKKD